MALRRTVLEVEVLWNDDMGPNPANLDLAALHHETIDGHASGTTTVKLDETVSKERMSELLTAQGSDPSFLVEDDDDEDEAGNESDGEGSNDVASGG